jgi:protein O-mannosyl-transferase
MRSSINKLVLAAAFLITTAVYWPGLYGTFLFDDNPNIVDNHDVQPQDASLASLVRAALSSPSSELKRPLASLSFAANYLATGLDPYWMKLTNLVIHLLNGLLVFLLARGLIEVAARPVTASDGPAAEATDACTVAALVAACWMLLPINLTGVLYVVQRMESMANLFVLLGLIGYVAGRRQMLAGDPGATGAARLPLRIRGFMLCVSSLIVPTTVGVLAKETAVMLPLYALLIEWALFGFHTPATHGNAASGAATNKDRRVMVLFLLTLVVPMIAGLVRLLPGLLKAETWATRDFTLTTRLLSEARIIADYIVWTLLPTPDALSFYHDDFRISAGLLSPWTTLASIALLAGLLVLLYWLRPRKPLVALGLALFLGCQLLTGTILPLELIYEHRNYFATFGLMLALVPLLAVPRQQWFSLPRHVLIAGLLVCWTGLTAMTAYAWGNPLRLAEDLAMRAPRSPRAQYELGRTYIIYSRYDAASPFTHLAYAPLERSAALPDSSILAEQALIFMNARMHLPQKDAWWDSLIGKLKAHKPTVQDESSLAALTHCVRQMECDLPRERMMQAFMAALSHPAPNARLLANYADYAWNVLGDHPLGEQMSAEAVQASPSEPAYRVTLIRMLAAQGRKAEAMEELRKLAALNVGGRLDDTLAELRNLPALH